MYKVELSVRAQRFLDKLETKVQSQIENRLKRLKEDAFPSDAKCLGRQGNSNIFRYRIGGFRVLYTVDAAKKIVLVHKLGKRSKVYQH